MNADGSTPPNPSDSDAGAPSGPTGHPGDRPGAGERIDAAYYDATTYFEEAPHLLDRDSRFQRYRIRMVNELARPRPDDRVVDFGCGWGTFEFALAPRVEHILGVDFSRRSIEYCRQELGRDPRPNVDFRQADAGDTGLPAESADLVVAADLYEHLYPDDAQRVSTEALRLLRPGGRFAVWTPHRGHILEVLKNNHILLQPDPTHVDYKSMDRVRSLLEGAGFRIERAYYAESHLPVLAPVERLLGRFVPLLRRRIAVLGVKPGSPGPGSHGAG